VNLSRRFQHSLCLVAATLALSLTSGCNMFSSLSTPTGDEQIISSCRAKFDDGDFQGAIQCYGQVSSSNQDIALSETAYAELAEQGASMENYAAAFGKGNVAIGPAITKFAESMIVGAGVTRRVAIYNAYLNFKTLLPINPNLSYLVEFLGSLSFAAEILAEEGSTDANGNPVLTQVDLNTFQLTGSPSVPLAQITNVSQISASPGNYSLLNSALIEVASAVGNLGTQGTFSSSTITFAQLFQPYLSVSGTVATQAYIQSILIPNGVGETGN
jgi:hypothetical protein